MRNVNPASHTPSPVTEGALIRTAMGGSWHALSEKTRARFETDPAKPVEYVGSMSEVRASALGKCFAYAALLMGSPLIPYSGTNVPIDVLVYTTPQRAGIFKKRTYHFAGRKPFTVETFMANDAKHGFIEYAALGLGMTMEVRANGGKLYFHGKRYLLHIGPFYIPLPHFLTPGLAQVEHSDHGDDAFRVRIEMRHPWFGVLFVQDGIFREKKA